jgi:hypothetical protein
LLVINDGVKSKSQKRIRCVVICTRVILLGKLNNIRFGIDEIRVFKGYEHLTDEQACELADFLAMYAVIFFENMN